MCECVCWCSLSVSIRKMGALARMLQDPSLPDVDPASETQGHPPVQSPSQALCPPCSARGQGPRGRLPGRSSLRALMTGAHWLGDSLFQGNKTLPSRQTASWRWVSGSRRNCSFPPLPPSSEVGSASVCSPHWAALWAQSPGRGPAEGTLAMALPCPHPLALPEDGDQDPREALPVRNGASYAQGRAGAHGRCLGRAPGRMLKEHPLGGALEKAGSTVWAGAQVGEACEVGERGCGLGRQGKVRPLRPRRRLRAAPLPMWVSPASLARAGVGQAPGASGPLRGLGG